jgi:hypothetical protein
MMQSNKKLRLLIILIVTGGLCFFTSPVAAEIETFQVESGVIYPDSEEAMAAAPQQLSDEAAAALFLRLREKREQVAEQYLEEFDSNLPSSAGLPQGPVRETEIGDESAFVEGEPAFPGNPATLVIWRNSQNARANSSLGSPLAEPAAVQSGSYVFAAGNLRHAEFSFRHGTSPFFDRPLPAGPADAPILCCDHDLVMDNASRGTYCNPPIERAYDSEGELIDGTV